MLTLKFYLFSCIHIVKLKLKLYLMYSLYVDKYITTSRWPVDKLKGSPVFYLSHLVSLVTAVITLRDRKTYTDIII